MSEQELVDIVDKVFSFPPKVIVAYAKLDPVFTSGDLARIGGLPRSSAKFYLKKMLELRLVTKIPLKKKYQKFANASTFSDWLNDLIRLAITPLEEGKLALPNEE